KALAAKIKPILGVETYVAPRDRFSKEPNERYHHLILLAENQTGWKNLLKLVTDAHLEGFYYKPRVDKDLLRARHDGLIALSACLGGEVAQALIAGRYDEAKKVALEYRDIFGANNYFLEIQKHTAIPDSEKIEPLLIKLSAETGIPLVATQDSHYVRPEDNQYHDVLLAVQTGNKLTDDDRLTMKDEDFSITSPEDMAKKFEALPGAVERTADIAARCNVELELGKTLLPDFPKPAGKNANVFLRELIEERIGTKFKTEEQTKELRERLDYELSVIEKTGFADYFLIVQDLVNWAKTHGIAVGPGRGSAAGSLVSYILNITDINPITYGLLFERFLNPERIQMPDIDIDFSDRRRDEVLAYAREKYGETHVARIITFGTMAARAALRDAGRAMDMSYGFCDQIAKLIPFNPTQGMHEGWLEICLKKVPELKTLYDTNEDAKRLIDTALHLEGVARHASVHACATVISKDPLVERVPLQFAPQEKDTTITQFEMHAIEDLGLLKIDFLGLKNLTIIEDAIRLIKELQGVDIDISNIPLNDKKTFELFQRGDMTGVFQFESSGMRRYMKELKPTQIEDLIALVALFRPGPMELIPTFIKRKHGEEKITYLHPLMEDTLRSTYGVIVYQEQVMDMATKLAGLTRGEGYLLIKAVGKKIKKLLDEQKEKFLNGCAKNNIPISVAEKAWGLIEPFARYGFNKAHSACYAMIAYRTAYLKANYPEESMAALLNNEMNDIDRTAYLIQECKQAGVAILPPDVNASFVNFTPDGENKIRFGLLAIKNVGEAITQVIIEERARGGPFKNFTEFLTRIQHKDLNKKSLESMAKGGVFDSMGIERNQILANIDEVLRFHNALKKGGAGSNSLFGSSPVTATLKLKTAPPATASEKLIWEKELLGFYLSDHPLNAHSDRIKLAGARTIAELRTIKDDVKFYRTAGMVRQVKRITTKKGDSMLFVTLEDFSPQPLELVVFPGTLEKTSAVWESKSPLLIEGKMSWRNGEPSMICERAKQLEPASVISPVREA
ncbi:MAG: DNA polymerase III subunit alpha, partial [bacterium]|nr:DNA polymerase III subunit alpha [bacterium]